ncbi:RHS repeat domain-containing protein [Tahibacter caeni]|uniref:RHS repeat domain-containing protein n=1 Tax=Tahibacter caeni TaxID=1453545 RepID=UPI002147A31E|nr:RHS repeat-associated core domain-containing protein [Tahibacter caeni]
MRLAFLLFLTWLLALPASAAERSRSFVYNDRNQLTDVVDAADPARSIRFTYDANGNRETKTQGGTTTTYRWDARDRLIEVLRDGVWVARYGYNAGGQRTFKEVNGPSPTAVRYVYDGPLLIAETNVIGNTLAKYHYSASGRLLAMERAGQHYFYLLDGLGTPIAMTSAEGLIVVRYRVDAWGNPIATVGDSANIFGFTGYPVDDETGLHYANARYYDSELGAFLSEDPAQGDPTRPITLHPYLYGIGNPLIYLDRSGRTAELVEVLDGHERNQADIVALAEQIKSMRASATWYERPVVEVGMLGTVLLTAGNRLGEGVVTMANAGANVVLNATDTYIVDLGEGADPANAEVATFAEDGFAAAEAAYHDPRAAAYGAMAAAAEPYQKAYDGDTGAQLDLAASLDPRSLSKRVLRGMAPARGPPHVGGSQAHYITEGGGGRPELTASPGGPSVSLEEALAPPGSQFGSSRQNSTPYTGGPHSSTKLPPGDGLDSHHMPAKAISGLGVDPGPAIKMDPADHHETTSNGRQGLRGERYRMGLKAKIDQGRMRDAMATEVRDVRRAAQVVSNNMKKYNQAMQEMLDYAKGKGWLGKGKKE